MSTFHAADKMIKRAKTWEISDSEAESDTENHLHRSQTGISTVSPEFKWRLSNCDKETSTTTNNNNNNKNNNNNNAEHYDQSVNETPSNATHEKDALALPQTTTGSISDSPSPTGKRNRRTQEEIEADKIKAEQKKEEREAQKRERERVKEEKRLEQQKRKQAAELLKCYRPDQCLKYMTVCIDPAVLEVAGSEILWESVHMMESRSTIQPQPVPCSITWTREIPQCNTTDVAEMEESSVKEEQIMMLVSQEEFLEMAVSMKQSQLGLPQDDDVSDSKSSLLFDFLQKEPGKTGTLAVLGCEPHSWCFQRGVWRGRGLEVTEADIEEEAGAGGGAVVLRGRLVGWRGESGEGRGGAEASLAEAAPAAQQSEPCNGSSHSKRLPFSSTATAGLRGVQLRAGPSEPVSGYNGAGRGWGKREAARP
ncbi:probable crossover junction endonuclease EME2 isoform X4 [Acipenser ruthenus]|uniref:probable crossover junction endonuclease EME2 isoform X4 n=1 Tax=Acipenser ruthenus TaxID=7906 RepID=UPI00145AD8A9|nr:probable crossover junction endonuclease EME2 isoform X4 [Acipenser ruthenus]